LLLSGTNDPLFCVNCAVFPVLNRESFLRFSEFASPPVDDLGNHPFEPRCDLRGIANSSLGVIDDACRNDEYNEEVFPGAIPSPSAHALTSVFPSRGGFVEDDGGKQKILSIVRLHLDGGLR
jgi:hypothetical protein